jgi:uncharacterized protein (TIGR02246 family)
MKRVGTLILVACAVLTTGPALAADGGAKALDAAFVKAFLAGDAAAAAALYADDAVLVLPGSPAIKGGKAIAEAIAGFLKDTKVTEFALTDTHSRTAGHLSAGWGHYKMTTVPKAGGAAHTETGTYCDVAAEKDGAWKYVSDHASADPPPPAAAAPAKK